MTLETTEMNKPLLAITALVSGAAAMYFLDPEQGRRRRAQVRDQVVAAGGDAYGFVGANAKRAADQTLGALASARRFVWPFGAPTDAKLKQRIRAQLGRLVSHPRAVDVDVAAGCVRMRGKVLRHELATLMTGLWAVNGVQRIINELAVYPNAGNEPELQGEGRPAAKAARSRMRVALPLIVVAAPAVAMAFAGRRSADRTASESVH